MTVIKFKIVLTSGDVMNIIVSKDEIKRYLKVSILSEMTQVKEKIRLFEKKYDCSFSEFEKRIKDAEKENFEMWDDYIEWKAYMERFYELKKRLRAVENAESIEVT